METYSMMNRMQFNLNGTAKHVQDSITCSDSYCLIRCEDLLGCAFTEMTIHSTDTLAAVIECQGGFSCLGSTVVFNKNLKNHKVNILCLGM